MKNAHFRTPEKADPARFGGYPRALLLAGALLLSPFASARAQWTAYFDYARRSGTAPTNVLAFGPSPFSAGSGYLTNQFTGMQLPAFLKILSTGSPVGNGVVSSLVAGTPAYTKFNGYCDLGGYGLAYFNTAGQSCSIAISNLSTNLTYTVLGTVRGSTASSTLVELLGAASQTPAHTPNVITNGLATNQAALINNNSTGDYVSWTDIDPGPDGAIEIKNSRYGSSGAAFAISALKITEDYVPVSIVSQTLNLPLCEGQPGGLSVELQGAKRLWFQWQKDGINIEWGTNQTFTIPRATSNDAGGYVLIVSNRYSSATSAVATVTVTQAPPMLASQPCDQNVCPNDPAVLAVTAYGMQETFYQWRHGGTDIPNQTNDSYSIASVTVADAGEYSVLVSNVLGVIVSSSAMVRVLPTTPVVLISPAPQTVATGTVAQFAVVGESCRPLACQWQRAQTNLTGATNSTLVLSNVQMIHAGNYRAVLSNSFGVAISEEAALIPLTVAAMPGIPLNCTNLAWTNGVTINCGRGWGIGGHYYSASFVGGSLASQWLLDTTVTHDGVAALRSAAATGTEASTIGTAVTGPAKLSFWWKMSTNDSNAALLFLIDGGPLVLSGRTNWEQKNYYLGPGAHTLEWIFVVNGSMNHPVAWLDEVSILTGADLRPAILSQPLDTNVFAGGTATFRVTADGYPPLRYQWQFQGEDVPNAILPVLSVTGARAGDGGCYTVRVVNDFGAATSAVATLTLIDTGPSFVAQPARVLAVPGFDVVMHAGALGSEPMCYQWSFNGAPLAGETNAVLVLRDVGTNQAGIYTVAATNAFGGAVSPPMELVLSRVSHVVHISADGLSAKYLATGFRSEPFRYPNFQKLVVEGTSTLNARCDYSSSLTVPNHLCMLTGRPVLQPDGQPNTMQHGYTRDDTPSTTTTVHNTGNPNVPYKASVFDVAHDRGFSTAFFASKGALFVCAQSYDATNGAPDLIPPDNGRAKIDYVGYPGWDSSNIVNAFLPSLTNGAPFNYAFLHIEDMDAYGHGTGWGSPAWFDALQEIDRQLGRILTAIETSPDPAVALQTAVMLTADHGGYGSTHGTSRRGVRLHCSAHGVGPWLRNRHGPVRLLRQPR